MGEARCPLLSCLTCWRRLAGPLCLDPPRCHARRRAGPGCTLHPVNRRRPSPILHTHRPSPARPPALRSCSHLWPSGPDCSPTPHPLPWQRCRAQRRRMPHRPGLLSPSRIHSHACPTHDASCCRGQAASGHAVAAHAACCMIGTLWPPPLVSRRRLTAGLVPSGARNPAASAAVQLLLQRSNDIRSPTLAPASAALSAECTPPKAPNPHSFPCPQIAELNRTVWTSVLALLAANQPAHVTRLELPTCHPTVDYAAKAAHQPCNKPLRRVCRPAT